jgi:hypothetical protein
MLAGIIQEIVRDFNEARQLRRDRRVEAWLLPYDEALAYFARNGVPLSGVSTREEFHEALTVHCRALQRPEVIGDLNLEIQIGRYLGAHGQARP